MNYSDLTPKFKIGDDIFVVKHNIIIKTNVIGLKIRPLPNKDINPFYYQFSCTCCCKTHWIDAEACYETFEELKKNFLQIDDQTSNYSKLAAFNADEIKRKII